LKTADLSLSKASNKLVLSYSLLRTLHFSLQQLSLPFFEFLSTGKSPRPNSESLQQLRKTLPELFALLKQDAFNISAGLYPLEVLRPEAAPKHFLRFPKILLDGYSIAKRRRNKKAHDFDSEAQEFFKDVPEYYQRNFHYQSGGYLTPQSAELYEHQVEILFAGAADAMRRLIIPMMKEKFSGDGEGLHFLEVAAGTGRLTRFMKLAYPKAKITVSDLSDPYLRQAQKNLGAFSRINFVQAAAEKLPFQDQSFDGVYSCFLFHELPYEIRVQAVREGLRILKEGGVYGLVDSVQKDDAKDFNWALEQFPVDFHEPFYKNYTLNPMEGILKKAGYHEVKSQRGFFSKAVIGLK
jgi:ubiquinone/menaquinone biosynthesis C-methylase UbiE